MPATLDSISKDALMLPPEQRAALACRLLESIDLAPQSDTGAAWEAEIARRIASFDVGGIPSIPASVAFASLRKIATDR